MISYHIISYHIRHELRSHIRSSYPEVSSSLHPGRYRVLSYIYIYVCVCGWLVLQFRHVTNGYLLVLNTLHGVIGTVLVTAAMDEALHGRGSSRRSYAGLVYVMMGRGWLAGAAALAAVVFRRHLMVWGLWAPKVVFEFAMLGMTDLLALVVYLRGR